MSLIITFKESCTNYFIRSPAQRACFCMFNESVKTKGIFFKNRESKKHCCVGEGRVGGVDPDAIRLIDSFEGGGGTSLKWCHKKRPFLLGDLSP